MRDQLEEVLLLQTEWTSSNTAAMERRGRLIRSEMPEWLRTRLDLMVESLPPGVRDLRVEGRDGTGLKSQIPWVRVYSLSRSPSATQGWYVVYLFSAGGDRVYLTLMQGTTRWEGGEFRPRPVAELKARVEWARSHLAEELGRRPDVLEGIALDTTTGLARGYEQGVVAALAYEIDAIPTASGLAQDLDYMVSLLARIYLLSDQALEMPGEPAPEVSDAIHLAQEAAGKAARGQGYRLTVAEKAAVERRAVDVVTGHLMEQGWKVKDVGATRSYDLDARRGHEHLHVEVKGTTSRGDEVILTANEVHLHTRAHPHTMLAIVHDIALERGKPPIAGGGTLRVISPWLPDADSLRPLSFRYVVPPRRDPTL